MFGVILHIAATFVAVVVMGINLSSKSDEIQKLKAELANPQKDSGSKLLDIDAMYRVVQEEGYFPTKDSDGDITFKINGTRIVVGECAEGFVYTRVYYGLHKEDVLAGLYTTNVVNKAYVAVKSIINEEKELLIFSIESYCIDVDVYRVFFQRSISILADSVDKFEEEMQKCSDRQSSPSSLAEEQNNMHNEAKVVS